jgi:acetyltransferase-like isoleucine patch superfamily enzyme
LNLNSLILNIKRGETPVYRLIKKVLKGFVNPRPPRIPGFLKPPLRVIYAVHFTAIVAVRWVFTVFYRNPLFQARCASVGKNLTVAGLPWIEGHVAVHIGDDVSLGGISIGCGRFIDNPTLVIKDRVQIGWDVRFTVNREIVIEEDVMISYNCRLSDSDGHPKEADLRAQHAPLDPREIRPVRICRSAWIGNGSHIMKGVTIGEGAVIGANSVVISDVPPYCLALGNPAEVYFANYGRPSKKGAAANSAPTE